LNRVCVRILSIFGKRRKEIAKTVVKFSERGTKVGANVPTIRDDCFESLWARRNLQSVALKN